MPFVPKTPVAPNMARSVDRELALTQMLDEDPADEADLANLTSRHREFVKRLRSDLRKGSRPHHADPQDRQSPGDHHTTEIGIGSEQLFGARIGAVVDHLLAKVQSYDYSKFLLDEDHLFAFSSWATFSRYSKEAVTTEILSALDSATCVSLGQKNIGLEDLESLSQLRLSDEGVRGVYLVIGYGPNGEIAIYIGSTQNLLVRIAFHDLAIADKHKSLDVYRTLSQEGWTHTWRVLARFPPNVHQCNSYMLESIMILVAQSLDPSSQSGFHPAAVRSWIAPLLAQTPYTFSPIQLNHCLPFKQGFSVRDGRVKECVGCFVRSDSPTASPFNRDWFLKDPLHPCSSYECHNCWRVRYKSGKLRAPIEQNLLESKQEAQHKRNVVGLGKLPSRCDWCGQSAKKVGLHIGLALCLCKSDSDRAKRKGIPKPPSSHPIPENGMCDMCASPTDICTFLPFPAAKFVCAICLPAAGPTIRELARRQHILNDSFKENPMLHPFMQLLENVIADEQRLGIPQKLLQYETPKKLTRRRKAKGADESPGDADNVEHSDGDVPDVIRDFEQREPPKGVIASQHGHDDRVKSQGEARKAAREWRGLERRIDVPVQCDYCGNVPAMEGQVLEKCAICLHTRLVLCPLDKNQTRDHPRHQLPDLGKRVLGPPQVNFFGSCDLCDAEGASKSFTFIPYPIKAWSCSECLSGAGNII